MTNTGLRGLAAFGDEAAILGLTEAAEEDTTAAAIGSRIREARTAAGLSGEKLGSVVGLSKDKISKIESGKRRVDISELAGFADALGTSVRALLGRRERVRTGALAIAARLAPGADADADRALRTKARELLEIDDLLTRKTAMPSAAPSPAGALVAAAAADRARFPERPRTMNSAVAQGRELAAICRQELNLGSDAIGDLAMLTELHFPVDVTLAPFGTECDGLCVHSEETAFVLVSSDYPEGHVRFTLAHELGHHLLGDPRTVIAEDDHKMFERNTVERRVNAFAGYFLMPEEGIRETLTWLGYTPGDQITVRHVAALMERFDVSRQALLIQLRMIGLIPWDPDPALDNASVARLLANHIDVAPTGRANQVHPTFRAPQRLVRAAREAAQREELGLGILASLLGRDDDDELWDEVMGEVTENA